MYGLVLVLMHNKLNKKLVHCSSEAEHCPEYILNKTIILLSNTVKNNRKTVIDQRNSIGTRYNCFKHKYLSKYHQLWTIIKVIHVYVLLVQMVNMCKQDGT